MYKIMRKNKRFNNKTFNTYEEARSYVRKWIRKNRKNVVALKFKYSNPSISNYNFIIKAI